MKPDSDNSASFPGERSGGEFFVPTILLLVIFGEPRWQFPLVFLGRRRPPVGAL